MSDELVSVDLQALSEIVAALNRLDPESRGRLLSSLMTLYGVRPQQMVSAPGPSSRQNPNRESTVAFSEDRTLSAKDFVWQKQPKTAIERVVCLGYYLQHFRGMQSFRTTDISELNSEAAQVKLSNPAMMVSEATRAGYLATVKGQEKQLTVIGEQFVSHLPDRESALNAVRNVRPKRSRRKGKGAKETNSPVLP
jgi:hypothetical protein